MSQNTCSGISMFSVMRVQPLMLLIPFFKKRHGHSALAHLDKIRLILSPAVHRCHMAALHTRRMPSQLTYRNSCTPTCNIIQKSWPANKYGLPTFHRGFEISNWHPYRRNGPPTKVSMCACQDAYELAQSLDTWRVSISAFVWGDIFRLKHVHCR